MEENDYRSDFELSLSALEDIQTLSDFSLSPVVSRVYYHLSEMKRKVDEKNSGQVAHYEMVAKVLDEKFESIISDFFNNKSKFKKFGYHKSTAKIDLKKWNLIFEIIPEVLSIVTLFNYYGEVETKLDENLLLISGMILEDGYLEINRKFIYTITRKLLREKVLLTFNLTETAKPGFFKLDLKIDISHNDSLVYKVNFKPTFKENYLVGFSNIFCRYRMHLEDVKNIGEHHVIDVGNDLSVKYFLGLPDTTSLEFANKEILHFSFLFRPISIILPMKGSLSVDSFSRNLASSQDDEHKREQDVSTYYQTIDFFSLLNI